MSGPSRWARFRAVHPEYRRREADRLARRRATRGREDRSAEYRNRARRDAARRELEAIPPLHTGHELFDLARAIVGPVKSGLTVFLDPLHEDLLSEAVVALLAGADTAAVAAAVHRFRAREYGWRRITGPLVTELAAWA